MEFEKNLKNHGKSWDFVKLFVCLIASLLAISGLSF